MWKTRARRKDLALVFFHHDDGGRGREVGVGIEQAVKGTWW